MAGLDTDVRYIKGIGEARAKALNRQGIFTMYDLLRNFPRAYEDRTAFKSIAELVPGETACIRAMVAQTPTLSHVRRGLDLVKLRAVDSASSLNITFFNQAYMKNNLHPGETYVFYGKVTGTQRRPEMINPVVERESDAGRVTGRIVPIYRMTSGLTQSAVMKAVQSALDDCADLFPEPLPENVRRRYELAAAGFSYENVHLPADAGSLELARRRFVFEELYILALAMRLMRRRHVESAGVRLNRADVSEFYDSLPFELTGAQKRAIDEAFGDMTRGGPAMSRLVQGDVGSGKTAVAAACCWLAKKSGKQSAFMAPTEILAEQHYRTLSGMLEPLGVRVDLLTGHMTAKQKREACARAASGETDLLIGTHALISEGVEFSDLALVVTDEQHRFGVEQRAALKKKGEFAHVMVMSATPIPRTLALIIYGDLDVSVIDEMPPGRQKIDTYSVGESMRPRIYNFMRDQVNKGGQVFVVCPMVEEGEEASSELKSAAEHAKVLQEEVFPDLRVGLIHGKLKQKEKDSAMQKFASGETDILVATTVIEVGVDVPNASLMVVENADRFGLSQLHQLRGRVGRGARKAYCVLFQGAGGDTAKERLSVMCSTNDGFKIAEEDLRLRGPGDFFGSRQHGLPAMHMAGIAGNMTVLADAQDAAEMTLHDDPELGNPENALLRREIERLYVMNRDTFN